jgi:hypothetical protein
MKLQKNNNNNNNNKQTQALPTSILPEQKERQQQQQNLQSYNRANITTTPNNTRHTQETQRDANKHLKQGQSLNLSSKRVKCMSISMSQVPVLTPFPMI